MIRDAYDEAKKAGNIDAMVKALGQYAKYNQLDKEDVLDTRWETLRPQQFIMTDDPTVIGFKPIPNIREKIKAHVFYLFVPIAVYCGFYLFANV